jgi:tyrosinase
MKAFAAGQPPERRSLEGLAWNDPIVATYRDGVGQLKQRPASDSAGWAGLAGIHGINPDQYNLCPHSNWYFLPWHRAYLVTYERIIRQLTHNDDFALPYWDWTTSATMPQVFLRPTTPDGKKNWLFVDDHGFGQRWRRTWPDGDPMPARFVGPTVFQEILNSLDYEDFGTSRPQNQDSLDPSWVLDSSGLQGTLEALPHNNVHNLIGGWMPSALSPRDPIFFMHHCNIDRIWAMWNAAGNANSTDPLWTGMAFTNNFINPDRSPYSPQVSDLVSPEALGYTYGLAPPAEAAAAPSPNVMSLQNKLVALRGPRATETAGTRTFSAAPGAGTFGTAETPLALPVSVDPALIAAVASRKPVPSGAEVLNFSAAREQRVAGPRILAFLRDVAVTNAKDTEYRVFLDRPQLTAQTPVTDPGYVGSFGVLVHGNRGEHGTYGRHAVNPSFVLDLTRAVQRAYGSGAPPPDAIKLQFIPVPNRPGVQPGNIRPGRVEIAFINV